MPERKKEKGGVNKRLDIERPLGGKGRIGTVHLREKMNIN
jgi:hypothetical protein